MRRQDPAKLNRLTTTTPLPKTYLPDQYTALSPSNRRKTWRPLGSVDHAFKTKAAPVETFANACSKDPDTQRPLLGWGLVWAFMAGVFVFEGEESPRNCLRQHPACRYSRVACQSKLEAPSVHGIQTLPNHRTLLFRHTCSRSSAATIAEDGFQALLSTNHAESVLIPMAGEQSARQLSASASLAFAKGAHPVQQQLLPAFPQIAVGLETF